MNKKIWIIMVVLAIPAFLFTSCKKDDEGDDTPANTAPTASFTLTPETGNIQTAFLLDASASSDAETPANELLIRWDGNDDGSWDTDYSTIKTATVTYDTEGTYTIRLEVKDSGGLTGTTTQQVTVSGGGNLPPDPPADPDPADDATDVLTNISLQWTGSDPEQDPLSFDIYFGTSAAPPLVGQGSSQNSYDPGIMEYETKYYWKITAHDDHGNTTDGPLWSFTTGSAAFSCGDDITDPRDGKIYGTVQIGTQCWMAQNIDIGTRINGVQNMSDDGSIEKYCYNDLESNCEEFGALYQWGEMMQYATEETQGICPAGWHLPAREEWEALEMALGMPEEQATATSGWQGTNEGTMLKAGGSSGFNALMSGWRTNGGSFAFGDFSATFWAATSSSTFNAWGRTLDSGNTQIRHVEGNKELGNAVRCLKD
ncbi:MAG: hypothetical protein HQ565_11070 [Bacteroidetes bacterium]|nr:hypothetical protein [Bacteroidota bacterium]